MFAINNETNLRNIFTNYWFSKYFLNNQYLYVFQNAICSQYLSSLLFYIASFSRNHIYSLNLNLPGKNVQHVFKYTT